MARRGAERQRQLATSILLASLVAHGCSGSEEPYIGAHRAGFGRFLQALRDEMPMYDERVKMVRDVCVSAADGRWLIVGITFFRAHNVFVCGARWMQKHSLWKWCGAGRPSTGSPTSAHPWMARECVRRNACIRCALRLSLARRLSGFHEQSPS
jgi:hypothetical protein